MYGYITPDNIVGQLFEVMPTPDTFHPDFLNRILPLPEGVTSGWRYDPDTGEFSPPPPAPEPEPTAEELLDILLGVKEI